VIESHATQASICIVMSDERSIISDMQTQIASINAKNTVLNSIQTLFNVIKNKFRHQTSLQTTKEKVPT
jgi:hypothetical protein